LFYNRLPRPLPPVRLVGVGVTNFTEKAQGAQPDLFDEVEEGRQKKLDQLLDSMQSRFGRSVVRRGKRPE
jgi:DNA polymerase IV